MSDDDDEDTHFCLRCNTTITGLDAYVAHRKSRCNQAQTTDRYGAGPSGLHVDICRDVSPVSERQRTPGVDVMLHSGLPHPTMAPSASNKQEPQADDYFFSSLCLQSSSKIGEPGGATKHNKVLTRSKILEKSNVRDDKPAVLHNEEVDVNEETESEESDDERHPPPTSGGKWLPGFRPTQRATSILWKSAVTPEHKPAETETKSEQLTEVVSRPVAPPPSHTRGKWDSSERPWGPLRNPNAYWCGPCNRRLSSRIVYERHIKSELHFKRTNPWRTQVALGKRARRRTRVAEESSLRMLNRKLPTEQVKGAKRRRGATVCDVCNYRVAPHLMGKHLISHYHCSHPRNEKNDEMVLKCIPSIVRQSPFQCGLCKFYCNTQQTFSSHWASEMHRENDLKRAGVYWCPNCDFEADSSVDMSCHLNEDSHRERVRMINHSVPLIIPKITPLQCDVCGKCFRYNIQIRAHSKAWGHEQIRGTASNSYQEALSCSECPYKCYSLVSFQRHCYMKHKKIPYFCRRCGLIFNSSAEVKKHRKSTAHRDALGPKTRHCPHCKMSFPKLASLKSHLEEIHPNSKYRCLKCGEVFSLKQQLSQHALSCRIQTISDPGEFDGSLKAICLDEIDQEEKDFSCNRCQFSGKTESELMVHKVLHDSIEPTSGKFHCPYCNKTFNDSNMKKHMMTHTTERPYSCEICSYSFSRQDTLNRHVLKIHHVELSRQNLECGLCDKQVPSSIALDRHMKSTHQGRTRSFKCMECDQAFYEKGTLDRHMQTHFGKKFQCPEDGCIFIARSLGELKIHARTHSESRDYHCQQCTYCSKTKNQLAKHMKLVHMPKSQLKCPRCKLPFQTSTHLKRHMRTHSGTKPYQCPHCPFTCASLDNLRKHIIYSKIHPGKNVYECRTDDCSFATNLSKDFKSHLVRVHNLQMKDAMAHVAGIYKPSVDTPTAEGVEMHEMSEEDHDEDVKENEAAEKVAVVATGEKTAMAEFVFSAEVVEEDARLPTLASVALTPAKTDEDIIFMHIGGSDEQTFDPHIFHQSFPIIEAFPGQSHYDNVETETTQEENP